MSEFRIFCFGGFVGAAIFSALDAKFGRAGDTGALTLGIFDILLCGCIAVVMFGKRP